MQRAKWQRKKNWQERVTGQAPPDLALVADASGQTYRVSLQELVVGQPVMKLYGKDGKRICDKPKIGRQERRETITRAEIRRVINPPSLEMQPEMS